MVMKVAGNGVTLAYIQLSPDFHMEELWKTLYRVIQKNIHFQKFILQKLLVLNPCSVYGWKGDLSKL
jgi:hypothetical protein